MKKWLHGEDVSIDLTIRDCTQYVHKRTHTRKNKKENRKVLNIFNCTVLIIEHEI